jgi:hypothetical protein
MSLVKRLVWVAENFMTLVQVAARPRVSRLSVRPQSNLSFSQSRGNVRRGFRYYGLLNVFALSAGCSGNENATKLVAAFSVMIGAMLLIAGIAGLRMFSTRRKTHDQTIGTVVSCTGLGVPIPLVRRVHTRINGIGSTECKYEGTVETVVGA